MSQMLDDGTLKVAAGTMAALAGTWLLRYVFKAGLFTSVHVQEKAFRACKVYYKTHIGAYSGCGRHFGAACSLADAQGVPGWAAIGVYFDDPGQVAGDKCRYLVGIRAPDGDSRLDTAFRTAGYSIVDLPATRAVHATFPFTGLLSILLGVRRVYPALGQHNKEAGPFVELTDPRGKITEYYGMLENSSVFMVGLQDMATYAKNNPRK